MDEVEWEDASWLDLYDEGHASDDEWQDRAQRKSLKRARKSWRNAE
jgi:hypothetical protein